MAITITDLARRIGPRALAQLLDDDGDGEADEANVAAVLGEALEIAHGILKGGYTDDDVRAAIIEGDLAVRGAVCDIAIALAGRRPSTLGGAGEGAPYATWRKEAEAVLQRMATAERRVRGEDTVAGAARNAHVAGEVQRMPTGSTFVFGAARGRQPGGF